MTDVSRAETGGTRHYSGTRGASYLSHYDTAMAFNAQMALAHFGPFIHPGDHVVDFGCGNGELLHRLDASSAVGVEVNEHARRAAQGRGVRTVASSSDLPGESADVVVSHHALEHTVDPYGQLMGLWRVLKPGGRLVLVLPLDDWRVQRKLVSDPNHHLYAWTPLLLRNLLQESGFAVQSCVVINRAPPPRYSWQIYRALPRPLFELVCTGLAVGLRRRQLFAMATRPDTT